MNDTMIKFLFAFVLILSSVTISGKRNRTKEITDTQQKYCLDGHPQIIQPCTRRGRWNKRIHCPNTYRCSRKDNLTCCQYNIQKDMNKLGIDCKEPYMTATGIPWSCRGGGSAPCPDGYKCRPGPGNLYTLCCKYIPPITCEHRGYIHPQKDGKWFDIDGCTVCECISQDRYVCDTTLKCKLLTTCKEINEKAIVEVKSEKNGQCMKCDCNRRKIKNCESIPCEKRTQKCKCGREKGKCKPCQDVTIFSPCSKRRKCTLVQVGLKCIKGRRGTKCKGLVWKDCPGNCTRPMDGWGEWSVFSDTCRKNKQSSKKRVRACQNTSKMCPKLKHTRIEKIKQHNLIAEIEERSCKVKV